MRVTRLAAGSERLCSSQRCSLQPPAYTAGTDPPRTATPRAKRQASRIGRGFETVGFEQPRRSPPNVPRPHGCRPRRASAYEQQPRERTGRTEQAARHFSKIDKTPHRRVRSRQHRSKYHSVDATEAVPLRDHPTAERRAAVDFQSVEKIPGKQYETSVRSLSTGKRLDALPQPRG